MGSAEADLVLVFGLVARCLLEPFVVLLSPYAPHLTEELWEKLGNSGSVSKVPWPKHNEEYLAVDEVQYSLLINGKVSFQLIVDESEN